MRGNFFYILAIFLGVEKSVNAQDIKIFEDDKILKKDSLVVHNSSIDSNYVNSMQMTLDEIVVDSRPIIEGAKSSALNTIYGSDANKIAMSHTSGVHTTVPISSRFRINNMEPAYVGMHYSGMPILLDNTQFFGAVSIINSFVADIDIKKTAHTYGNIGSAIEIRPHKYKSDKLMLSSDLVGRSFTFAKLKDEFYILGSFKHIGTIPLLEKEYPDLEVLPEILEFTGNLTYKNFEMFSRIANGKGQFANNDIKIDDLSTNYYIFASQKIFDNTFKGVLRSSIESNTNNTQYTLSKDVEDEMNIFARNVCVDFAGSINLTHFGLQFNNLENKITGEGETKNVLQTSIFHNQFYENFLLQIGAKTITSKKNMTRISSSVNLACTIKNFDINIAYSHPVNMLVTGNSSMEKITKKRDLKNQYADHYLASIIWNNAHVLGINIGSIEVSFYHKYFDSGIEKGTVKGIDAMISYSNPDMFYSIKYSYGDAKIHDRKKGNIKMPGALEHVASADFGIQLFKGFFLSTQALYNSKYDGKDYATKKIIPFNQTMCLSAGASYDFSVEIPNINSLKVSNTKLFDMSIYAAIYGSIKTQNMDRSKLASINVGGQVKTIEMPFLGDVRITLQREF
ncbi:MAG: hypothetical protein ACP5NV_02660 [Candidatus Woesearchaeota archaeon]